MPRRYDRDKILTRLADLAVLPSYSWRSEMTGSTRAARRAGR
jgi:hypothetical protein